MVRAIAVAASLALLATLLGCGQRHEGASTLLFSCDLEPAAAGVTTAGPSSWSVTVVGGYGPYHVVLDFGKTQPTGVAVGEGLVWVAVS